MAETETTAVADKEMEDIFRALILCMIQELLNRLQHILADETSPAGAIKHGWMKEEEVALDPVWTFMKWDPESRQQVESGQITLSTPKCWNFWIYFDAASRRR